MAKAWTVYAAVGLASSLLLARLWILAPARYLLLAFAVAGFAMAGWTWARARPRRTRDPYDLSALNRIVEEDEMAQACRVTVPDEADTVVCPHCGTDYTDRFPVCPECRRSP